MVSKASFLYLLAARRTPAFLRCRRALLLHAAVNEAAEAVRLNHTPILATVLCAVMAKTREADRTTHPGAAAFAERAVQHHFGNLAHQQVTSCVGNGLQPQVFVY